jgi:uncharacterized protein (TIGR03435 family)
MSSTVKIVAIVLISAVTIPLAHAQSARPAFEVASLKRNMDQVLTVSGVLPSEGGRVSAKAATLKQLIQSAYQIKAREIEGGLAWMDSERYDIEAKAANNVAWDSLRPMLQTLLVDRFQLRIHTEERDKPVYVLMTRGPLKLTKSEAVCEPTGACGFVTKIGQLTARQGSFAQLAEALSAIMDRPVIDKTNVPGLFKDVKLEWVPDEAQYASWGTGAYKRIASDPLGPSIFTAIQEQLGLKLESARGPVEVLVIDYVSKPSEN